MKKFFQTISSFFLAIIVMVASLGFTMNKHYCGGELKKFAINAEVAPCPMCANHTSTTDQESHDENECCENDQEELKIRDFNLSKKVDKKQITDFQFITLTYILIDDIHAFSAETIPFSQYLPPLIDHDIPVEIQSFLL